MGVDPLLVDPQAGDYRVNSGSPAVGYGCRVFARREMRAEGHVPQFPPAQRAVGEGSLRIEKQTPLPTSPRWKPGANPPAQRALTVGGLIDVDTLWDAAIVRVVADVNVADGVTLAIAPGTQVEFEDYFRLSVSGTLQAIGTPAQRIVFTTDEPAAFAVDDTHTGCWNGVRFHETRATNAPSRLEYCILEYSKAVDAPGPRSSCGGAVSVIDYADLTIANCIFRHNVADYGGAISCYRNANITLAGNLLHANHALSNGAVVYAAYSHPRLVNNTLVRNLIANAANPFEETCAILSFIGKPQLAGNIIRDNEPAVPYLHTQLRNVKHFHTLLNNIAGLVPLGGNIDANPRFAAPDQGDFRLTLGSPSIDVGSAPAAAEAGLKLDLDGRRRRSRGRVDQGAYELLFGDLNCDGHVDFKDINPFVLALTDTDQYAIQHPDCAPSRGDLNADGGVTFADIDLFVAALGGY